MVGRPPKPTAIKAAEGNPGKRRLNRGELAEDPEAPKCPKFVTGEGRKLWKRLTLVLLRRRIIREEDQMALANLCAAWSILNEAHKRLAATPEDDRLLGKSGSQNPLLYVIRDQVRVIHHIGSQFGFSPAARARLTFEDDDVPAGPAAEKDLDALLGGDVETDPGDPVTLQ